MMMRFRFLMMVLVLSPAIQGQQPRFELLDKIVAADQQQFSRWVPATNAHCLEQFDVIYYRCVWNIDPGQHYIRGMVATYFRLAQSASDTFCLNIHDSLQIDSVRYHGNTLSFQHSGNLISMRLADPPLPGLIDSVNIYYQGIPPSTGFGSFVTTSHNGIPVMWTLSEPYGAEDWWPCKNTLTDKADSVDLFIIHPEAYRAAGNGELISEHKTGNEIITHWKHRYPIATYLVAIAVSNYARYWHKVPYGLDTVNILQYVYPEDSAVAVTNTPGVIPVMQLYDSLFGIYPFFREKYGQCQISWGGGMEHQTFTFMGSFDHELISHELAHSWFGNKITCGSWQDIWLNEGFASYLTGLSYEHMFNGYWWMPFKKNRISKIVSFPDGSVWCDDTTRVERIFDSRLSYAKGAMILHQLRWIMGDHSFFEALNAYLSDPFLSYGFARTADLKAHLEASFRHDLTWYFDDWFTGQGYPSYQISWSVDHTTVNLTIVQTQSHPSVNFFELPLPLKFKNEEKDTFVRIYHTFSGETFTIPLTFSPDSLFFDPDLWLISSGNVVSAINEPFPAFWFSIYPNPADQYTGVYFSRPLEDLRIRLLDISGREIGNWPASGLSFIRIPTESLPAGCFFLEFKHRLGREVRKLLVE